MSEKYLAMETYPYQQADQVPRIIVIEPTGTSQMTMDHMTNK